jgi:MFS family permease
MRDGMSRIGARLVPPLGARAWRLLAGVVAFEVGTGLTLPLVIVYLHGSRGLSLAAAGVALSAFGAGGLAGTVAAGPVVDRLGAGWTAVVALLVAAAGTFGYLAVHGLTSAVAASLAQGAGFAGAWVAIIPLLVTAVEPGLRGDVLATNYGIINLGLGLGSTIAGVVLAVWPDAFGPLFGADALTYVIFAAWLVWLGELRRPRAAPEHRTAPRAGYAVVVRDPALLAATGLNLLLVTAGYAQLTSAFPAWATGPVGVSKSIVGFAFAANTWAIAVAQLPVLAYVRTRRRTRATAVAGMLFALCWLVVLAAGQVSTPAAASAALIVAAAVFGLGETFLSPSLPAIVNDVAPEDVRGRYVAVYSTSWQVGPMIGPAIAGVALGAGAGGALLVGLAAACGLAWPAAVLCERLVPASANLAGPSDDPPGGGRGPAAAAE